jgi:hypothetical protein
MTKRNRLIWVFMAGGATLFTPAPVAMAQGAIRVESKEVLVPAVVFDRKLDALMGKSGDQQSLSYLIAHDTHFWESIAVRDLVARDFHLFEDGQEQPIHRVTLEPPAGSIVHDSMGVHPESIGSGGGRWSYSDQPEKELGTWLPWPQYLIAFVPQPSAEGSCHHILLKTGRANLVVWTRSEYCNTIHPPTDPLNGTEFGRRMEDDLSLVKPSKIRLKLQATTFLQDPGATRVYIEIEFPWQSLKHEFSNGTLYASIGALGMVYNKDGSLAARFSDFACCDYGKDSKPRSIPDPPEFRVFQGPGPPGSSLASADSSGFAKEDAMIPNRFETQIDLPPGEYNIRVVLSDGEKFGRQQMPLTVDRFDGKELAISDIALCKRIREVPGAPAKLPGSNILPSSKGIAFTPTANPVFKKNKRLYTYFEVYVPPLPGKPATLAEAHLRIVDARTGDMKIEFPSVNVSPYLKPGSSLAPVGREINLSSLSKGLYRLDVQATDSTGKSTAWRTTSFSVE